eukprot:s169_g17.t1
MCPYAVRPTARYRTDVEDTGDEMEHKSHCAAVGKSCNDSNPANECLDEKSVQQMYTDVVNAPGIAWFLAAGVWRTRFILGQAGLVLPEGLDTWEHAVISELRTTTDSDDSDVQLERFRGRNGAVFRRGFDWLDHTSTLVDSWFKKVMIALFRRVR